jgi:hypothetical protein
VSTDSTSTITLPEKLSSEELTARLLVLALHGRSTTALLVAHLAVFDSRRLYLGEGFSSLFSYCTGVLKFSEAATSNRIVAARTVRQYPEALNGLVDGSLNLTNLRVIAPHLRSDNSAALLDQIRNQPKRDVERLAASLAPRSDVTFIARRMPRPSITGGQLGVPPGGTNAPASDGILTPDSPDSRHSSIGGLFGCPPGESPELSAVPQDGESQNDPQGGPAVEAMSPLLFPSAASMKRIDRITPLSADRYRVQFMADEATIALLNEARDLLRHRIPSGDRSLVIREAIVGFVGFLRRRRRGAPSSKSAGRLGQDVNEPGGASTALGDGSRPVARHVEARPADGQPADGQPAKVQPARARPAGGRHIPVVVRRSVWERDEARCTFRGATGNRCEETGWLEFHHVLPFALGGKATADNIVLRCRAHNQYEGRRSFGKTRRSRRR